MMPSVHRRRRRLLRCWDGEMGWMGGWSEAGMEAGRKEEREGGEVEGTGAGHVICGASGRDRWD